MIEPDDEAVETNADEEAETAKLTDPNPHVAAEDVDHGEAMKRYDRGWQKDRANIEMAYVDLLFQAGEQWFEDLRIQRENDSRPVLTYNLMGQFVRQVTGDMRELHPAIKVVPTNDGQNQHIAEIREGLIRYIENRSDASTSIYPKACDSQVACGIGHWEVFGEYADDTTNEQEIGIRGLDDQLAVIWDPDAKHSTRKDGMFCFVPVDLTREAYTSTYPDHAVNEMGTWDGLVENWFFEDKVRVCRYWYKVAFKRQLMRMPDGAIEDLTLMEPEKAQALLAQGGKQYERDGHKIYHRMMNCTEFLTEPVEWPGRYIPIVPLIGEEVHVGARIHRMGIIRQAADAQRAYNYYQSTQAEFVGLQPKAPFVGTEINFRDYEEEWSAANVKNYPYLRYTPDPTNGNSPPQRQAPPSASSGLSDCINQAHVNIQAIIGIYNASLGAKSNETSGVAISRREQQGDTGTYVYMSNFALAITHTARIINDLIPHYYDTARTVRILNIDGSSQSVGINQPKTMVTIDGVAEDIENDITVGSYDIQMELGPSYNTKREEAKDGMTAFITAYPPAGAIIPDMVAKAQDWPNSDEIAERLQLMLPPPIQAMLREKKGLPPAPPPPPSPAQQAETAKAQAEGARAQAEGAKAHVETLKAQTHAQLAPMDMELKKMQLLEQQMKNAKAELDIHHTKLEHGKNGPPVDQAKLHTFINETQEALSFVTSYLTSQIAQQAQQGQGEQGAESNPQGQAPLQGGANPSSS